MRDDGDVKASEAVRQALGPYVERYRELEQALGESRSQGEAVELKRSIIELYHTLDEIEHGFHDLKQRLRRLVKLYRSLPAGDDPAPSEGLAPASPRPRSDGLGSSTYKEKAWNCMAVEDYDGAVQMLQRALDLAPDDVGALSSLGWAQMMRGDHDEALLTYQRVLVADPDDALARVNLGYICLKKGIFGEAIEHLSKAIRGDRDRKATLYAHYYMGLVYLARQMYSDAEGFFERAIELGPAMSEAHFQLGRARMLSGRREAAIAAWRQGAAANRYGPWGKRCAEAASSGSQELSRAD